jgi:hypothetical protein
VCIARFFTPDFLDQTCFQQGSKQIHRTLFRNRESFPQFGGSHAAVITVPEFQADDEHLSDKL